MENTWVLFHVKIEKEDPVSSFSVFYKQEKRGRISLFIDPENTDLKIPEKSLSPFWMNHVFDLQKTSVSSAKEYVFEKLQKIKNDSSGSCVLSFRWEGYLNSNTRLKNDFFVQSVVDLLSSHEERG